MVVEFLNYWFESKIKCNRGRTKISFLLKMFYITLLLFQAILLITESLIVSTKWLPSICVVCSESFSKPHALNPFSFYMH